MSAQVVEDRFAGMTGPQRAARLVGDRLEAERLERIRIRDAALPAGTRRCDLYREGRGVCGSTTDVRGYLCGLRCPAHTPAALAGRPEADPAPLLTMAGLALQPLSHRLRLVEYGPATSDPLGRQGPGWKVGKNGLPVRVKGTSVDEEEHPW